MRLFFFPPFCQLTPSQVERDKWLRPPTSVQKLQTPVFGQVTFYISNFVNVRSMKGMVAIAFVVYLSF